MSPENAQADYLDRLDALAERYGYTATINDYDTMRVAYGRGLVTPTELGRWLRLYNWVTTWTLF